MSRFATPWYELVAGIIRAFSSSTGSGNATSEKMSFGSRCRPAVTWTVETEIDLQASFNMQGSF